MAYLTLGNRNVDSCAIANEAFTFTGKVDTTDLYTVVVNKEGQEIWGTQIVIEEGTVTLAGDVNDRNASSVSGTPTNDLFQAYNKSNRDIMTAYYKPETTEAQKDSLYKVYEDLNNSAYEANSGKNLLGLSLFRNKTYEMEPQAILDSLKAYPEAIQKSRTAVKIKEHAEKSLEVSVGKKYKEISLNDTTGKAIALSSVIKTAKYTLIDFWASWCGPCMGEVPTLVADYAAYHEKGFEIYGVSLDRDAAAWKACLAKNNMTWPNVSDVKFWNCAPAKEYAVNSIPANFLVDAEGTIIARNLRGEDLTAKLAELIDGVKPAADTTKTAE